MKVEKVQIPEQLFKQWLEEETNKVDAMDILAIQNRIMELEQVIFETKTRLSVVHQKRIKLQGSEWAENIKSITDPNFVVDYEKDPREKKSSTPRVSKEEKAEAIQSAAGIDKDKLKQLIKDKLKAKMAAGGKA